MNNKVLIIIFIIAVSAGVILYNPADIYAPSSPESSHLSPTLSINNKIIEIDIADTPSKAQKGLSGRESLGENSGMLFIFSNEQIPSFWMKDMRFAIDIIWINKNWEISQITQNIKPDSYPQTFSPKDEIMYVLEVNAGWSKKNNIAPGDLATLNR